MTFALFTLVSVVLVNGQLLDVKDTFVDEPSVVEPVTVPYISSEQEHYTQQYYYGSHQVDSHMDDHEKQGNTVNPDEPHPEKKRLLYHATSYYYNSSYSPCTSYYETNYYYNYYYSSVMSYSQTTYCYTPSSYNSTGNYSSSYSPSTSYYETSYYYNYYYSSIGSYSQTTYYYKPSSYNSTGNYSSSYSPSSSYYETSYYYNYYYSSVGSYSQTTYYYTPSSYSYSSYQSSGGNYENQQAMINLFTDKFSNYLDMRNGVAAQCSPQIACESSVIEMCCADVTLTEQNTYQVENLNRCMNKETVMYVYGHTIQPDNATLSVRVIMECLSSAFFVKFGVVIAATSIFISSMI